MQSTVQNRNVRIALLILLGVGILIFGHYLASVFNPLLIAFFLAYICNPLVNFFEKKGLPRTVSIVGIIGVAFAVIVLMFILVVPLVVHQVASLPTAAIGDVTWPLGECKGDADEDGIFTREEGNKAWPKGAMKIDNAPLGEYNPGYIVQIIEYGKSVAKKWKVNIPNDKVIEQRIIEQLGGTSGIATKSVNIGKWVFGQVGSFFGIVMFFVLIPVYFFFLLLSMNNIKETIPNYLPGMYRDRIIDIWDQIHAAVAGFFRGRLIIAFICTLLLLPFMIICEVPFGLVIAIVAGVSMIVPYLWIPFGLLPAEIFILLQYGDDWVRLIVVLVGFVFVANLDQFVLTPGIVGKEVELHPVTLIICMFVFGSMLGFFGLMLAIPLTATFKILGKEFVLPELEALAGESKAKINNLVD